MKKNFIVMSLCISSIFSASEPTLPTFQDIFGGMSSEEIARQQQEAQELLSTLSPAEQFALSQMVEENFSKYDSHVIEYAEYTDRYPNATAKQNTQQALRALYSTIRMLTSSDALTNTIAQDDTIESALENNNPDIIINKIKDSGLVDVNKKPFLGRDRHNKTILDELELNIPFLCSLYEYSTKVIKGRQS